MYLPVLLKAMSSVITLIHFQSFLYVFWQHGGVNLKLCLATERQTWTLLSEILLCGSDGLTFLIFLPLSLECSGDSERYHDSGVSAPQHTDSEVKPARNE